MAKKKSPTEARKATRKRSWEKNNKAKEQRVKDQKEREKVNREHAKTDPLGLTLRQRIKFDSNMARIIAKYGKFRPGVQTSVEG